MSKRNISKNRMKQKNKIKNRKRILKLENVPILMPETDNAMNEYIKILNSEIESNKALNTLLKEFSNNTNTTEYLPLNLTDTTDEFDQNKQNNITILLNAFSQIIQWNKEYSLFETIEYDLSKILAFTIDNDLYEDLNISSYGFNEFETYVINYYLGNKIFLTKSMEYLVNSNIASFDALKESTEEFLNPNLFSKLNIKRNEFISSLKNVEEAKNKDTNITSSEVITYLNGYLFDTLFKEFRNNKESENNFLPINLYAYITFKLMYNGIYYNDSHLKVGFDTLLPILSSILSLSWSIFNFKDRIFNDETTSTIYQESAFILEFAMPLIYTSLTCGEQIFDNKLVKKIYEDKMPFKSFLKQMSILVENSYKVYNEILDVHHDCVDDMVTLSLDTFGEDYNNEYDLDELFNKSLGFDMATFAEFFDGNKDKMSKVVDTLNENHFLEKYQLNNTTYFIYTPIRKYVDGKIMMMLHNFKNVL